MAVPTDVAGLYGWWKADAITGLADGASVGPSDLWWPDSSGNAFNAEFNNDGSTAPTYETGEVNGLPVVRFAGGKFLLTAASGSLTALTVLAAVKPSTLGTKNTIFGGRGFDATSFGLKAGKLALMRTANSLDIGVDTGASIAAGAWSVLAGTFAAATSWALYANGAARSSGSTAFTPTTGQSSTLGDDVEYGGNAFVGDIAEIVVYNAVLGSTDLTSITSYLGDKYAITFGAATTTVAPPPPPSRARLIRAANF